MHFFTTIMLVFTSQLCLYTLFQSSLEGIPKTANMKMINYWNMLAMTVSLTNFFTFFVWEILQFRGIHSQLKIITRFVIPLITLVGVICILLGYGWTHILRIHQIKAHKKLERPNVCCDDHKMVILFYPTRYKLKKRTAIFSVSQQMLGTAYSVRSFLIS